jgi:ceramide glucosyltransferase
MTTLWTIAVIGVVVGTGYYAFGLYAAWAFFRRRARRQERSDGLLPPVTLLKPLKGLGVDLEANLESFCRLDYPEYQILFAVADPDDAAVPVVERLRARYPHLDMRLVVNPAALGSNRKVSSLIHMMPFATHDIFVLSDSDIRVPHDYLQQIVQGFASPDVGLVTCLYRGVPSDQLPTRLEALFVNTDFMPMVFVANQVEKFRYAFGATIALRRSALDAIGGFGAIADHLADDYQLGYQITAAGYRAVLSPLIVETHLDSETWSALAQHQLRWARTYRVCRPAGYFFTILTHGTSWATALLLLSGFSAVGGLAFVTTVGVRLAEAAVVGGGYVGSRQTLRDLWLIPVKDWLLTALWFTSFLGNDVEWGGERLIVQADGLMAPVRPSAAPATTGPHDATAPGPSFEGNGIDHTRPSGLAHTGARADGAPPT